MSLEQRRKISESCKRNGVGKWMIGRVGALNNFYGKKHTEETKRKISNIQGGTYELLKCGVCFKTFRENPSKIKNGRGKFCSWECRNLGIEMPKGSDHHFWKGESASYTALHTWVRNNLGWPMKCEHCGTQKRRMYHWANVSKEYKRDLTDWIRLCVPCHWRFDHE